MSEIQSLHKCVTNFGAPFQIAGLLHTIGRSRTRSHISIMRVDSRELPLSAMIPLCQLLPCRLGPPRPTLPFNLYVKGCLDCITSYKIEQCQCNGNIQRHPSKHAISSKCAYISSDICTLSSFSHFSHSIFMAMYIIRIIIALYSDINLN